MDVSNTKARVNSRRNFLAGAGLLGLGATAGTVLQGCPPGSVPLPNLDIPILNFALNLEYLEAEYYLRAVGRDLDVADVGEDPGAVEGGREVNFTTGYLRDYAEEIARDELAHVRFIRSTLGGLAVSRPAINFTDAFNALAAVAGFAESFDPFASEENFFLGAFVFEDVGVTAYKGASPLLLSRVYLEAAAGILAVEAYHAATIRSTIWQFAELQLPVKQLLMDYRAAADAISNARDTVDGTSDLDQRLNINDMPNIVPADNNGIAFSRTVSQVLNVVYLNGATGVSSGGFFPEGLNGVLGEFTTT